MPLARAKTIPIITFRAKFYRRKLAHFVLESTIFKPPEKKKKRSATTLPANCFRL